MSNINANAKTKVYVGGNATGTTLAALKAATFIEIGFLADVGEVGDEAEIVTFDAIDQGRTLKAKGTVDAGDFELTVADVPADLGQGAMRGAMNTAAPQAMKIVTPGGITLYFAGPVVSARRQFGGSNDVRQIAFRVAVTTPVFEEAAV